MAAEHELSPQLRVALTPHCNLHCFYCRPEGEGWAANPRNILDRSDLRFLLTIAAEIGFSHIKFTGGEPLLRRDTPSIISDAARCDGITDVQMVTNGTLLESKAQALRDAGLSSLTISIDSPNPMQFRSIRGGDLAPVLRGLAKSREVGLPVRINMVVTRHNLSEIDDMMTLAKQYGASLKLLDLVNLDAPKNDAEWFGNFLPFAQVAQYLETRGAVYVGEEPTPGGVGAALLEYTMPSALQVVIKDSMHGTWYHSSCRECTKYPCQDALMSLRVTHDGNLKKCLIRDDNKVSVGECIRNRDSNETGQRLAELFKVLTESAFQPHAWKPAVRTGTNGLNDG